MSPLSRFWRSYAFTTGDFHEPLAIKPGNRRMAEQARDSWRCAARRAGDDPAALPTFVTCADSFWQPGRAGAGRRGPPQRRSGRTPSWTSVCIAEGA
jgi:hypothetical protein